ncbi:MAG: vitamin B12 dependent-methionine synthase activation domain-containing protein [Pseudomonadota bacterium]
MPVVKIQPVIEDNDFFCFLGGRTGQKLSIAMKARVEKWKKRLNAMIDPKIFYQVDGVQDVSTGVVEITEKCRFKSAKLSKTLGDCKEVVCFLATIGERIESEISRLFRQNRLADAYVLDAMGSAAVENLVEQFQAGFEEDCGTRGKAVTPRFSPGYCDWPVTEQEKLFEIIDSERIGVELNDSCLMTPRKSVSGVFGILPDDAHGDGAYTPCSDCRKTGCPHRRAPNSEEETL